MIEVVWSGVCVCEHKKDFLVKIEMTEYRQRYSHLKDAQLNNLRRALIQHIFRCSQRLH